MKVLYKSDNCRTCNRYDYCWISNDMIIYGLSGMCFAVTIPQNLGAGGALKQKQYRNSRGVMKRAGIAVATKAVAAANPKTINSKPDVI